MKYTKYYKPCIEAVVLPTTTLPTEHKCKVLPCDYFQGAYYITTDRNEKNVHVLAYDSMGTINIILEVVQLRHYKSFKSDTLLHQQKYNHLYWKPWDNNLLIAISNA